MSVWQLVEMQSSYNTSSREDYISTGQHLPHTITNITYPPNHESSRIFRERVHPLLTRVLRSGKKNFHFSKPSSSSFGVGDL